MGRYSLVVAWCALLLAACSPMYETVYSFTLPNSQEGRICAAQCLMHKQTCVSECGSSNEVCQARIEAETRHKYREYVKERQRKKLSLKLKEMDFRTGSCSYGSCNNQCSSFYRECFELCGGRVTATQVCTAFCDRKGGRS